MIAKTGIAKAVGGMDKRMTNHKMSRPKAMKVRSAARAAGLVAPRKRRENPRQRLIKTIQTMK